MVGDLSNRDLLAQFCSRFELVVVNTFLPKRPIQQVTYFDRRAQIWNSQHVDPVYHKQLDLFLLTASHRYIAQDIRSKRDVRLGSTTHHVQICKAKMPIQKRVIQIKKGPLPFDIYQDKNVMDSLRAELPKIMGQMVTGLNLPTFCTSILPDFDPINNDNYSCPFLIYHDGSFTKREAGWAFSVFTWDGDLLFAMHDGEGSAQMSTTQPTSGQFHIQTTQAN